MLSTIPAQKWSQFLTEVQLNFSGLELNISSINDSLELSDTLSEITDIPQPRISREIAKMWMDFSARLDQSRFT